MGEPLIAPPLKEACRQLFDQRMLLAADADVQRARRRIMQQTHLLQDAENELARVEKDYQAKIDELEAYIKSHALEVGQSFESGGIEIKYVKGHERVSLPKGKLDAIRAGEPELSAQLERYLKTTEIAPRVQIK